MPQKTIDAIQFWLNTTHRSLTVNEKIARILKHKFIEMLDADIQVNTKALQQSWSDKRAQMIGFMQSLRDELKRV